MALRFIGAIVVAALVGAAIGYGDDQDLVDAAIFAGIGVALVVWAGIKVLREKAAEKPIEFGRYLKGALAFAAIVLGAVGAYFALDASRDEAGFLLRDSQVEPEPVRSLKGIRLGERLADVSARVGAFDPESAPGHYLQRGGRIRLLVAEDRVARVSYECAEHDSLRVNRIGCNDRESRVIQVFGNGARRLCANAAKAGPQAAAAAGAFALDVLDTGTRYVSLQGQVKGFVVMEPRELEEALGPDQLWHRCS